MAEGTYIPGAPACREWEAKLTDALDGLLRPEEEVLFVAHKASCPGCAELYQAARKGREWLEFLSPEPEAPEGLLEKILATTGPGMNLGANLGTGLGSGLNSGLGSGFAGDGRRLPAAILPDAVPAFAAPVWQQAGFLERMRESAYPRLLMTAAMAFFSVALTLNLAGADLKNLRLGDLRPHALRSYMERQLNMASVPIVRYYDHLRIVNEMEERVREIRSANESEDNGYEQPQKQTQPAGPGETRYNSDHGNERQGTMGPEERASEGAGDRMTEGTWEDARLTPPTPLLERIAIWTA